MHVFLWGWKCISELQDACVFFARPLYKNSNNANTFKYSKKAKRQLKSL